jgi:hypothetical protein
VTPIGQQDPPGPLKLLDLRKKKQAKNFVFYFVKNTSIFSVCMYFLVCVQRTWLPLVGADPENNYQVPASTGIRIT